MLPVSGNWRPYIAPVSAWELADANPALSLTASSGVTLPFDLVAGIPHYAEAARVAGDGTQGI